MGAEATRALRDALHDGACGLRDIQLSGAPRACGMRVATPD